MSKSAATSTKATGIYARIEQLSQGDKAAFGAWIMTHFDGNGNEVRADAPAVVRSEVLSMNSDDIADVRNWLLECYDDKGLVQIDESGLVAARLRAMNRRGDFRKFPKNVVVGFWERTFSEGLSEGDHERLLVSYIAKEQVCALDGMPDERLRPRVWLLDMNDRDRATIRSWLNEAFNERGIASEESSLRRSLSALPNIERAKVRSWFLTVYDPMQMINGALKR